MIIINDEKYDDFGVEITWGNFSVTSHGKRRTGISPFISFNIENNRSIALEFTFSDEMFKQMKVNIKTNVKEYISDILYADERGWISAIDDKYECNITRINEKCFRIEFHMQSEKIIIDSIITLL